MTFTASPGRSRLLDIPILDSFIRIETLGGVKKKLEMLAKHLAPALRAAAPGYRDLIRPATRLLLAVDAEGPTLHWTNFFDRPRAFATWPVVHHRPSSGRGPSWLLCSRCSDTTRRPSPRVSERASGEIGLFSPTVISISKHPTTGEVGNIPAGLAPLSHRPAAQDASTLARPFSAPNGQSATCPLTGSREHRSFEQRGP